MKKIKTKGCNPVIIITAALILLIFQTIASMSAATIAQTVNYGNIDPNNVFAYISVHHVIQMIIALAAILIIKKKSDIHFSLKPIYSKTGIRYTVIISISIILIVFISYIISYKLGVRSFYNYPLNKRNVIGSLSFQLLLSGPSEEILFRALPLTVLLHLGDENSKKHIFISVIITSALFSAAHLNWSISPLQISFDNWLQLIYSFILGASYGITYLRSKSIIYPMILHSFSNIVMVGGGYMYMQLISSVN